MDVHDNQFAQLFAAFTNRDVTTEERTRLYELAAQDVGRRGALAEVEAVHELIGVEVAMRGSVMRPVEPAEEADESYRRLAKAAARAEEKLRANLLHPTTIRTSPGVGAESQPRPGRRRILYVAAAALLVGTVITVFLMQDAAPGLDESAPNSKHLGASVESIDVTTVITDDSPEFTWSAVDGAASYEATILDSANRVVLQRTQSRSFTDWKLTESDLERLRAHDGELFFVVVARDRAETERGRSKRSAIELR